MSTSIVNQKKRVILRDTDTSDILWQSEHMSLPPKAHELLTVAFVFDGKSAIYEFRINAIDVLNFIVYVTLERVAVNGVEIELSIS